MLRSRESKIGKKEKPIQLQKIKVTAVGYRGSLLPGLLRNSQNASQSAHQYIYPLPLLECDPMQELTHYTLACPFGGSRRGTGQKSNETHAFILEIRCYWQR